MKNYPKFSWIEFMIVIAIILIICRFVFARELFNFEKAFFQSLGINENYKFLITAPAFILIIYSYYLQGVKQVAGTGRRVISIPVILFALFSILAVVAYLWLFV